MRDIPGKGRAKKLLEVTLDAVQQRIPKDACLIEYLRYVHNFPVAKDSTENRLLALVICRDSIRGLVMCEKDFGSTNQIAELRQYLENRTHGLANSMEEEKLETLLHQLYDLMWKPIEQLVGNASLYLIAADGEQAWAQWGMLLDDQNRYLIERAPICYLSSAHDLFHDENVLDRAKGLLAISNPAFGDLPQFASANPSLQVGKQMRPQ